MLNKYCLNQMTYTPKNALQNYNHLQKEEITALLNKMLKFNLILQLILEMFLV